MSTTFDDIYERFFWKLESNPDFFDYYEKTVEESLEIAKKRASVYLEEAIAKLGFKTECGSTFESIDGVFREELTVVEVELLASLMLETYMARGIARLQAYKSHLTSQQLEYIHSPANERKTFQDLYQQVKYDNETLIGDYVARDRLTGERKKLDYDFD